MEATGPSEKKPDQVTIGDHFAKIECWNGQVLGYRASVYRKDGSFVGRSGGCKTPERALNAAVRIARRDVVSK